jgi:UDP-N-acetylmuramate dehydrogenase
MQSILHELSIPYEEDVPLAPLTWYGVGGPAKILARPKSIQQLSSLAKRCSDAGEPIYVLGGGANLLVRDEGVPGVVVQLSDEAFSQVKIDGTKVIAGGGCDLPKLIIDTARAGLAGLEILAGIPGSVGGALRMNAGGTYGEIGNLVSRVQVMDVSGQVYYRDRDDLVFRYRRSNIVAKFILQVEFELQEEEPEDLRKRVKEVFFFKKNSQPLAHRSAGCAFKNLEQLPEDVPQDTPMHAGKLIDLAGLKGYAVGGASVSDHHANFVVAEDGATAADILGLLSEVQERVREQFGVTLEREVVVWP